jgi:tetratricopeptide (TPR) repeat protein
LNKTISTISCQTINQTKFFNKQTLKMKKTLLASVALAAILFSTELYAQGVEDKLRDAQCESAASAIESAEKNTVHSKRSLKGSSWLKLADAYMDASTSCGRDSMSSKKAYEIYQKALEVDSAGDGKAKEDIELALKSPKLHASLLSQGAAYYNVQELDNALELFKLANMVNPQDTTTTLYAGIVAQQNGNMDVAEDFFLKHVANGGTDAAVFYSLSLIYNKEKEYDKSIEILKVGIEKQPNDKDLKGQLINTYIVSDKIEDAKSSLKALVDANPTATSNRVNLATIYDNISQLRKDTATTYENKGKVNSAKIYYDSAKIYYDSAKVQYNLVLTMEPDNYEANFNLGVRYFNEAVEIKKEVDAMDMKEYQKTGAAVEKKVCEKMTQAKPYFEQVVKSGVSELLVKFEGDGALGTKPFDVEGPWEIVWKTEGDVFGVLLYDKNSNEMIEVPVNSQGKSGASYQNKKGQFYLKVNAVGSWEVEIKTFEAEEAVKNNLQTIDRILSQCE